jgi:hypothetical protein
MHKERGEIKKKGPYDILETLIMISTVESRRS